MIQKYKLFHWFESLKLKNNYNF